MRHAARFTPLVGLLLAAARASAQDCDCDHVVEPGPRTVVGSTLGVLPGDRICVMTGEYEFLRLQGIVGDAERPVTIVNCGGLVRIHNADRGYALVVEADEAGNASQYFHLTGTGDATLTYGFEISAPATEPWPGFGLSLVGRSTNYEVDHLEIHDTGFAGISAKTDPTCDGAADQDRFVQRDIELHHLYIHETGGEALYIGSTQSYGQTVDCDGVEEVHQPHFLEGVSIHHNLIENTQWDGAQIGMARAGCAFYANTIRNVGLAGELYQQQGLQIGAFSSCEIYGNVLMSGPTNGVFVFGAQDSRVYDNLIVDFAGTGIYLGYGNGGDAAAGATYEVYYNTVVDAGDGGIRAFGADLGGVIAKNNLSVGAANDIAAGNEVAYEAANNLTFATRDEAGFVADDDYHLGDDSPARGAGTPIVGIDFDLDGLLRAEPPSVGAYEHAADSPGPGAGGEGPPAPSTGGSEGGGGTTPSAGGSPGGGAAASDDDAGCGCRAAGPGGTGGLLTALVALVALGGRRWRARSAR